MTMRIFAMIALCFCAAAQTYETNTWGRPYCTSKSNAAMAYNDLCVAPNSLPLGTFTPPASGWYIDPVFGSRVRRIHIEGATTSYQTQTPWSLKNTYILTQFPGATQWGTYSNQKWLLNARTMTEIRQAPSTTIGYYTWSSVDDDALYYNVSGGKSLRKYTVAGNTFSIVRTFDGTGGTPNLTNRLWISNNAEMNRADWLATGDTSGPDPISPLIVVNGQTGDWWSRDIAGLDGVTYGIDILSLSKGKDPVTGMYYVLVGSGTLGTTTPSLLYKFNETTQLTLIGKLEYPDSGGTGNKDGICGAGETCDKSHHQDTVQTADGKQWLVRTIDVSSVSGHSGRWLVAFDFSNEATMTAQANIRWLMQVDTIQGAAGNSVGCARWAPKCVLNQSDANGTRADSDTTSAIATAANARNIITYNLDTNEARHVANTRFIRWTPDAWSGYYAEPKGNLSMDGRFVSFSTNSGVQEGLQAIQVDTGADYKNVRLTRKQSSTPVLRWVDADVGATSWVVSASSDLSSPVLSGTHTGGTNDRAVNLTGLTSGTWYVGLTHGTVTERRQVRKP